MFSIYFIDVNKRFIEEIKKKFQDLPLIHSFVDMVERVGEPGMAFVSPANSLGFMDAGIDAVYSRNKFPGIDQVVKKSIVSLNYRTKLGRYYLPVGSALVTKVKGEQFLVTAPTMLLPQAVEKTRNAYYAFFATLQAVQKYNLAYDFPIKKIVCNGLCCGFGAMEPEQSVLQIFSAYCHFLYQYTFTRDALPHVPWVYFANPCLADQPKYYENLEFINFKPSDMIKRERTDIDKDKPKKKKKSKHA
jgi:hypothetical protein